MWWYEFRAHWSSWSGLYVRDKSGEGEVLGAAGGGTVPVGGAGGAGAGTGGVGGAGGAGAVVGGSASSIAGAAAAESGTSAGTVGAAKKASRLVRELRATGESSKISSAVVPAEQSALSPTRTDPVKDPTPSTTSEKTASVSPTHHKLRPPYLVKDLSRGAAMRFNLVRILERVGRGRGLFQR